MKGCQTRQQNGSKLDVLENVANSAGWKFILIFLMAFSYKISWEIYEMLRRSLWETAICSAETKRVFFLTGRKNPNRSLGLWTTCEYRQISAINSRGVQVSAVSRWCEGDNPPASGSDYHLYRWVAQHHATPLQEKAGFVSVKHNIHDETVNLPSLVTLGHYYSDALLLLASKSWS